MKKKRLAIVTTHPIQYNAPLFKLLSERNIITVRVFYTWGKEASEKKYDPGFGKVIDWDIPLLEGYDYEFLENTADVKGSHHYRGIINPDIISRIDAFGPDAVLVFGWSFVSHMKVLRHYSRNKMVIFRGDSTLLDKSNLIKNSIRLLFLKWVYRLIDYALYVGSNNYDYFKKTGLKNSQLIFAPHAIDNKRFSESASLKKGEAMAIRKSLEISEERIVFLFAGKLEEKKDPGTLLKAFEKSGISDQADLVVVGNGKLENELKSAFRQNQSIHFVDFKNQSEMPAVYRMADVFVLPSRGPGETWGLSVNEAMACGKAVLVSDKCGCAIELVDNGKNGYVFNAGDLEGLVEKLKEYIVLGTSKLKEMGEASEIKISDFTYDRICLAIEMLVCG
jgi:glycosyltransferase involved in cell wall biosynthesis